MYILLSLLYEKTETNSVIIANSSFLSYFHCRLSNLAKIIQEENFHVNGNADCKFSDEMIMITVLHYLHAYF